MPSFPNDTDFVDVPDPANPPVGAQEVDAEWLNGIRDYVTGLPSANDVTTMIQTALAGTLVAAYYDGSLYPVRPDTSVTGQHMFWAGPAATPPASGGTATGGTRAYAPFDFVALTAA